MAIITTTATHLNDEFPMSNSQEVAKCHLDSYP